MAERSLGGNERRVEPGGGLEIRDGLFGLIEIEQAGAAKEVQIARIGAGLDELGEKRERGRVVAAAVKRPRQAGLRLKVTGYQFQGLAPLGGSFLVEAVGIVGLGGVMKPPSSIFFCSADDVRACWYAVKACRARPV